MRPAAFTSQDPVEEFPPLCDLDILESTRTEHGDKLRFTLDLGFAPRLFGAA